MIVAYCLSQLPKLGGGGGGRGHRNNRVGDSVQNSE